MSLSSSMYYVMEALLNPHGMRGPDMLNIVLFLKYVYSIKLIESYHMQKSS